KDPQYFAQAFTAIQDLIDQTWVLAGHDISSGGLITALLEMCFPVQNVGLKVKLDRLHEPDMVKALFAENPGILIQVADDHAVEALLVEADIDYVELAKVTDSGNIEFAGKDLTLDIEVLRDVWFRSSYLLDSKQSGEKLAKDRFDNYKKQPLAFEFAEGWKGDFASAGLNPFRTEKGK